MEQVLSKWRFFLCGGYKSTNEMEGVRMVSWILDGEQIEVVVVPSLKRVASPRVSPHMIFSGKTL